MLMYKICIKNRKIYIKLCSKLYALVLILVNKGEEKKRTFINIT